MDGHLQPHVHPHVRCIRCWMLCCKVASGLGFTCTLPSVAGFSSQRLPAAQRAPRLDGRRCHRRQSQRVRDAARGKRAVVLSGWWVFFLIPSGSPHVLRAHTGCTCGEPEETELTAIGVESNGSGTTSKWGRFIRPSRTSCSTTRAPTAACPTGSPRSAARTYKLFLDTTHCNLASGLGLHVPYDLFLVCRRRYPGAGVRDLGNGR